MKKYAQLIIMLPIIFFCSKKDTKDAVATVGSNTITKIEFDAFQKLSRMYPTNLSAFYPGPRQPITQMVEIEAICKKIGSNPIKNEIKRSLDWQWKQHYYLGQIFAMEFLTENLGVAEKNVAKYYESHKDSLTLTLKRDSLPDSTFIPPLVEVKSKIVESLFCESNHPDSAFLSQFGDSLPDQETINARWISYIRQNGTTFFMKKLYKETTGSSYPDSLNEVSGAGKFITPADLEIILNWIPEDRKEYFDAPERQRELVEWLIKWKLFSEGATKEGISAKPETKALLDWAWKSEIAYTYINKKLQPAAEAAAVIDTAMLTYKIYDELGSVPSTIDSATIANKITSSTSEQALQNLDSSISKIRKSVGVTFLQADWKDEKGADPATLLKKADSLRDTGNTTEAESYYSTLSKDFSFTPEGRTALIELAKIQTEQQLYYPAINNYRTFLLQNGDPSKRCNTFFMIGFIYDEYLDKPELAEANYKWVLKNSPECELADDAEFMMLHLNEPMSSVEELQAEALRQGRKVEDSNDDSSNQ